MSFIGKFFGQNGEDFAVKFLKKNGYAIVERNFKTKIGEIDIIVKNKKELIFVEVKTRSSDKFGSAVEAVGKAKQVVISKVANEYLMLQSSKGVDVDKLNVRFDVIGLTGTDGDFEVNHVENAF